MAEIGRDYLRALLQMANRVAEYLEGITPEQRAVLEVLAETPASVNAGWVPVKAVCQRNGWGENANLGTQLLAEKNLIEVAQRNKAHCLRITAEGIDLLARIEQRDEGDQGLQRIRREWRRTVAPRVKKGETYVATGVAAERSAELRKIVLDALLAGPMRPLEVQQVTGLTYRQVENQLTRLRKNGKVYNLRGVYSLVGSQSKGEGAA
jgi:hypothetical protein